VISTEDWADYLDPDEPDPPLPAQERHVLDRLSAALGAPDTWSEPPPALRATLLQAAREEQARVPAPAQSAPAQSAGPHAEQRPPGVVPLRRRGRRAWYVSGLGVAAAAALVAVLAWPRPQGHAYDLAGTALAPRAHAVAELEDRPAGLAIRLEVKGLPPAPAGSYYAAWLRGTGGAIVPVGTFHWRQGGIPIDLWSGVSADRYPELFVTLQQEGQPPMPSSQVVLSGSVHG